MTSSDNNRDPSKLELCVFALMLTLFGAILASLVLWRPNALVIISLVAAVGWLVSLLLNHDQSRKTQRIGLVFPLLLVSIIAATAIGLAPTDVAAVTLVVGASLSAGVIFNPRFGRNLFKLWASMFLPLGWTVSHLILAVIYYIVLSPIGWVMRLLGRDPLQRRFDPSAQSYWIERDSPSNPERYFQQF